LSEDLPPPDPARIRGTLPEDADLLELAAGTRLVRVHSQGGPHPLRWNELRYWGPTNSRFDHHTPPPGTQHRAIAYLAHGDSAFPTALGEYFQDGTGAGVGPIDTRNQVTVTVFDSAADLVLLDLASGWTTRAGGNQAICSGPRRRSREWARAIYDAHGSTGGSGSPLIVGLAYPSSVWGPGRCVAVWESARHVLTGATLRETRLLSDPAMAPAVETAALALGTYVV